MGPWCLQLLWLLLLQVGEKADTIPENGRVLPVPFHTLEQDKGKLLQCRIDSAIRMVGVISLVHVVWVVEGLVVGVEHVRILVGTERVPIFHCNVVTIGEWSSTKLVYDTC